LHFVQMKLNLNTFRFSILARDKDSNLKYKKCLRETKEERFFFFFFCVFKN